jgi:hypothetical protein
VGGRQAAVVLSLPALGAAAFVARRALRGQTAE